MRQKIPTDVEQLIRRDLVTILVLIQRPHGAVGACPVLHKGPEPCAIDCVLAHFDTLGLREVLLKADNEPAIQALVDVVQVKRSERTMLAKSPKYSHQSNGAVENAVRRIESLTRVCVLQEKLGYKVDSKSIVLLWLVRHAAYMLSRFVKRDEGRSAWARLRGKKCDNPLAQVGETVDLKIVRSEMAKLEPRWATGTFLGRTDESDEVIVGTAVGVEFARSFRRRTRDKKVATRCIHDIHWCALESKRTGGGGSNGKQQEPSSSNTVRHQAVQHVWEFCRSTQRSAESDSSG